MAVWIYAYGKNGLGDCDDEMVLTILNQIEIDEVRILGCIAQIANYRNNKEFIENHYAKNRQLIENSFYSKSDVKYQEYLDSVKFPEIAREKIVDYMITDQVERLKKKEALFQTTFENFRKGSIKSVWEKGKNRSYFNRLVNFCEYSGLRIWFLNDLIGVSGPSAIFSHYGTFQNSINRSDREYFHYIFKQLLKAFKSDFILYTHEWAGLDDEEDHSFNLKKLKEQSDWNNSSSSSIHNMTEFYFEKINESNAYNQ